MSRRSNPHDKWGGFVYFAEAPALGMIKIGYSLSPERRMRELMSAFPFDVLLIGKRRGPYWQEEELHAELVEHLIRAEWYPDCPIVRALIDRELRHETAERVAA